MLRIYHALLILTSIVICLSGSTEIQARSTNAFQIGQVLSAEQMAKIPQSRQAVYRQTVGRIRPESVLKHGTLDAYIKARGVKATAGKVFEAMTANRFRAYAKNGERLVTTASLGLPNDVADLYRISSKGVVLDRYQMKAGYEATIKALRESKYAGTKIATHPEQLTKIRADLRKEQLRGKPLSPKWLSVDEAIRNGRLIDSIEDMTLSTRQATIDAGERHIKRKFERIAAKQFLKVSRNVPIPVKQAPPVLGTPSQPIHGVPVSGPVAKAPQIVVKIGKTFITVISVGDVAYSGYRIHDTISRRHEFDSDIYAGKLVAQGGLAGTGAVGLGMMLLAAPEPTFVTKAIGGAILVSSLAFTGTDIALDYAHLRRLEERSRQLIEIDTRARHGAVDNMLRKMIVDPDGRFY